MPRGGRIGADDLHLFNEGTHRRLYERLGAHLATVDGQDGVVFAVWAPNAVGVSVIGDFNGWQAGVDELSPVASSGIWEGFVAGVGQGARYKLRVSSRARPREVDKADPYAFATERPPLTASVVSDLAY